MPLIRTKLLPATNTKGTRIKAYYGDQDIIIGYGYNGGLDNLVNNHKRTVIALLDKVSINWADLNIHSERLNKMEYVHIWDAESKQDNSNELPEFLTPQA